MHSVDHSLETQIVPNFGSLIYSRYCHTFVSFSPSLFLFFFFEIFSHDKLYIFIYIQTRICPLTFTYEKRAGWYFLAACLYIVLCCGCSPQIMPFLSSLVQQHKHCPLCLLASSCQKDILPSSLGLPHQRESWSALLAGECYFAASIEDVLQILNCSLWMQKDGKTRRGIKHEARYWHAGTASLWLIVPPSEIPGVAWRVLGPQLKLKACQPS